MNQRTKIWRGCHPAARHADRSERDAQTFEVPRYIPDLLRCNHPSFAAAARLAKFSGLCAHACVLHSAREGVPELGALHTRGDAAVTDETDAEPLYTGRVLIRVPPNREDDLRDASPDISTN